METIKMIALIVVLTATSACTTSKVASEGKPKPDRTKTQTRQYLTLADYLRGIPGVEVRGAGGNTTVLVRAGGQSFQLSNQPIYTIDGVPVGTSYQAVNERINVDQIASVKVLKSKAETVLYGSQGVNGVIAIKLKKS